MSTKADEPTPVPARWLRIDWNGRQHVTMAKPRQRTGEHIEALYTKPTAYRVPAATPALTGSQMERVSVDELARLYAIEHYCWHMLDDSEDDGQTITIDPVISKHHLDALNELLPEGHPDDDEIPARALRRSFDKLVADERTLTEQKG